jgi:heat shock protein HslJ
MIDMMDGADGVPASEFPPVIEFSAEATPTGSRWLSGSGGCARYMGAYDAGRSGSFSLDGPLVITRGTCSDAELQLLSLYSIGMESATRYSVEGDSLAIDFAGGTIRFVRAVPPGA